MATAPPRLAAHLAEWLGAWSEHPGLLVVGSTWRERPGWDGTVRDALGVLTSDGSGVLSLPPSVAPTVQSAVAGLDLDAALARLGEGALLTSVLGRAGRLSTGSFRWAHDIAPTHDTGEWVPTSDPRVPEWLRPFNGDVLVAWDATGAYGAGVGRKQHDRLGHEISVGTEPALRGRGIARRLVATAARRIAADGAIATYLHAHDNLASAAVAEASGFPDRGWQVLGFW